MFWISFLLALVIWFWVWVLNSILAWRIPWKEEPGGLQSVGSQRVRHDWMINTFTLFWISSEKWFRLKLWLNKKLKAGWKRCIHIPLQDVGHLAAPDRHTKGFLEYLTKYQGEGWRQRGQGHGRVSPGWLPPLPLPARAPSSSEPVIPAQAIPALGVS